MATHPNCRCTMVPIVRGLPSPQWKQGQEWFEEQDQATQMGILGKGKYYAWQNGEFELGELVKVKPNATWGDTLQTRTLGELTGPKVVMPVAVPQVPKVFTVDLPYRPAQETIEAAREVGDREIAKIARTHGVTADEVEARLIGEMRRYVDGQVPRVRANEDAALAILQDGKIKTQFEVETSGGSFTRGARANGEALGLGYPIKSDITKRPVYGYYDTPNHGAIAYGQVEFVTKPQVAQRTTVTLGDSLYQMQARRQVGVHVNAIGKEALGDTGLANDLYLGNMRESYIEAQIHKGLTLDDVAEVILHPNGYNADDLARVEKAYKAKGIKVTYGSIDEY
jgi:hypothetical protein